MKSETRNKKMIQKDHLIIYLILLYSMIVMGAGVSVVGLSILEIADNMKVKMEKISFGMLLSCVFACLGSLIGTYTLDKYNRQLQFALCNGLLSFIFMFLPFIRSLPLYFINQSVNGLIISIMMTIPSVWVVEMFENSSKTYLQIMHFFFPIGQMFGPLMTAPFLRDLNNTSVANASENLNENASFLEDLFETAKYSQLWIPYLILGSMKFLISCLIIAAFLIKPYERPIKKDDLAKGGNECPKPIENERKKLSKNYLFMFVCLICLVSGIQLASEFNAITYISAYLVKSDLRLDQKTAAYCQEILSTSETAGRFVNVFITMKIRTETMIFLNFFFMALGNFLIILMGHNSSFWIYAGCVSLGYGFSNAYPMMINFVEERVTLSNKIMSWMFFSGSLFNIFSQTLVGRFLDSNPSNFIFMNLSYILFASLSFTLLLSLQVVRRLKQKNKSIRNLQLKS